MKVYKVIEARRKNAEKLMNEMVGQGWEVVSTSLWRKLLSWSLLITFSKEKQSLNKQAWDKRENKM